MENATVTIGAVKVRRIQIIGTGMFVYKAYEPTTLSGPHSSVTTFDGVWFGDIATRTPTPELQALPAMSQERYEAVGAWYTKNRAEACALILQAFPEAAEGHPSDGSMIVIR